MSDTINFPKDFEVTENGYLEDSIQYVYFNPSQDYLEYNEDDFRCLYSVIIGKDPRIQSNGVNTYELYDFRNEEAYGHVTQDEINEIINQNI